MINLNEHKYSKKQVNRLTLLLEELKQPQTLTNLTNLFNSINVSVSNLRKVVRNKSDFYGLHIPLDVLVLIMSYLPTSDVVACFRVCKSWYEMHDVQLIWKTFYLSQSSWCLSEAMKAPINDDKCVDDFRVVYRRRLEVDGNWRNNVATVHKLQTTNIISSLLLSENHEGVLYTAGWDKTVRAHYLPPHQKSSCYISNVQFHGHRKRVNCLTINQKNEHIISGSDDRCFRIWDCQRLNWYADDDDDDDDDDERECLCEVETSGTIKALHYNEDLLQICSSGSDGVHIWSVSNGSYLHSLQYASDCVCILTSSGNVNDVITGDLHGQGMCYDLRCLELKWSHMLHSNPIINIHHHYHNENIILSCDAVSLKQWDLRNFNSFVSEIEITTNYDQHLTSTTLNTKAQRFLFGGADVTLVHNDETTHKLAENVNATCCTMNYYRAATALSNDHSIHIWDFTSSSS